MLNLQKCWNDGQTPVFIGMNWVFFSLKSGLHLCELKDFQLKIRCVFVGIEGVSAKIRLYGRIDDFWLKVYNVYIYIWIHIYIHTYYIYIHIIYIDILYIYILYIYIHIYIYTVYMFPHSNGSGGPCSPPMISSRSLGSSGSRAGSSASSAGPLLAVRRQLRLGENLGVSEYQVDI